MAKRAPLAPKFYGGVFGAGSGGGAAAVAVALIQAGTRHALDPAVVQAIYYLVPIAGTAAGIFLAPHQARPGDPDGTGGDQVRARLMALESALGQVAAGHGAGLERLVPQRAQGAGSPGGDLPGLPL